MEKFKTRKDFLGLSTEEKPETVNGSTFLEVDTSKKYIYYENTWYEMD